MECRHRSVSPNALRCTLAESVGVRFLAGSESPFYICPHCEAQWADGKSPDSLPEVVLTYLEDGGVSLFGGPDPPLNPNTNGVVESSKLPSVGEMISNFASSMIRWASAGFPTVDKAMFDARLAVCQGTESKPKCHFWDPEKKRCTECGCRQVKLHLATEKCPVGKWGTVTPNADRRG